MMQPLRGKPGCHPSCDGGAKISALRILPKAGQRGKGSFRRLGRGPIVDHRVAEAGELPPSKRQFLGPPLSAISSIARPTPQTPCLPPFTTPPYSPSPPPPQL